VHRFQDLDGLGLAVATVAVLHANDLADVLLATRVGNGVFGSADMSGDQALGEGVLVTSYESGWFGSDRIARARSEIRFRAAWEVVALAKLGQWNVPAAGLTSCRQRLAAALNLSWAFIRRLARTGEFIPKRHVRGTLASLHALEGAYRIFIHTCFDTLAPAFGPNLSS
jgi:hypothetical protein